MGLEALCERRQAADAAKAMLSLSASCSSSAICAEVLRATVWSLTGPTGAIHVNRVLSAALSTWRLLSDSTATSEETLRAELRDGLSTLEDAGDLVGRRGGYWAPAATRFVMLPNRCGYLLVGGAPTAWLPLDSDAIHFHGPHRHFADIPAELEAALPMEDFDSWTGRPENTSLREWAREVFESFERASYTPSIADAFDFYLPANSGQGTPQFRRWSESAENITDTLLARRNRVFGIREYRLVDVRAGRIVSACELHGVDARRLMYALDLEASKPVRARPTRVGDQTEWLLTSELPRAEQRAFAAFGTLAIPAERPFERRWTFMRNEELALDMLRSLGIALGQLP